MHAVSGRIMQKFWSLWNGLEPSEQALTQRAWKVTHLQQSIIQYAVTDHASMRG